jgi:UDP-glucose 4-epimerase
VRILVTGGAGFIGSHLTDAFVADGHEVAVVDDLSSGDRASVHPRATLHVRDIADAGAIIDAFRPAVLCHHAAQIDVRRSVRDPAADAETNVVGTLRLLEACRRAGTSRVLFASTGGAIYGEQTVHPATEEHPTRPRSPYGVAKLAIERYLDYYASEHGLLTTALRYANVFGPRQSARGEAGVVAIFADRLARGEAPIVHGDGEQTRDFVHVRDVVEANRLVLRDGLCGVFNVGTGVETSINELAHRMARLAGVTRPIPHGPAQPGEQRRSSIDPGLLASLTGWRPMALSWEAHFSSHGMNDASGPSAEGGFQCARSSSARSP